MRRALPLVLAAGLVVSCARTPVPRAGGLPPASLDLSDETWVRRTLAALSLEQRVGQLLFVPLPGGFENVRSSGMREAQRLAAQTGVGGFVTGGGSPADLALKLNELQAHAQLPLLVAADLDQGPGLAVTGATGFPFNLGMAATHDTLLAELAGRITAAEARAVGIHWLLAPRVDLGTGADNPFSSVRSYGGEPAAVAAFGRAFIRGAAAGGVLTTAVHFPGQGGARADQGAGLPVLHASLEQLRARELVPLEAVIASGVPAVQLGHAAVPALTGGARVPAGLAPGAGSGLLRAQLGFGGLVVTEALNADVLREMSGWSPGEVAVRAVEAGADVVYAPPDPVLAHRALVDAVRRGRIHYSRVDSSVVRILRAKARLGLHRDRTVALDSTISVVGAPEHGIVAADIARRAVTLARDSAAVLPLDPRRIRSVAVVAFTAADDVHAGTAFAEELARIYGRGVRFTRVDARTAASVEDSVVARAARADATVLASYLMPTPGQPSGVPPELSALAARLHERSARMAVVAFGDPFGPAGLPGASTYLLVWQPQNGTAGVAAARAIAGRSHIPGRLPILLPRTPVSFGIERPAAAYGLTFAQPGEVGMDARALARVDTIINRGILGGAAPGAVLAVGRHGRLVRLRGYGTVDRRRGLAAPVNDSTIYDLASMTKVVATTTAVMMLVDDGVLRLDDPVVRYLPDWAGSPDRDAVTIRNLLLHNAGLPAYAPLWRELSGREQYLRRILRMPLQYPPGSHTLYSDFGAILLGMIVEEVSGRGLDEFLRDRLFRPLGMHDTGFNPLRWPAGVMDLADADAPGGAAKDPLILRIAPTENDTVFRMRHVRGQVHDENAFALGGVAGHAGLFSSGRDLAIFAQLMLNRGWYGSGRFIDPATVELFTRRFETGSSRALGWDTPEGASSAGSYFTEQSFGHTGFTGPMIWIDPERDVFIVLLMNRVNPTRENQRHVALRRDVADAVQLAITDMPVTPRRSGPDLFGW